jgi:lysine biosynthesis protein LysW
MTCPTCSGVIDLDEEELDEGDPVTCEECGADLKVASVHPVELEPVLDEEDDDEDEDEEDFDEDEDEDDDDDEDLEDEDEEEKDEEWS